MSYAIEVDWRQDNPVTGIKRKSEKGNRRDRVLEVDEERALQAACDEHSEALGLIFSSLHGYWRSRWRDHWPPLEAH